MKSVEARAEESVVYSGRKMFLPDNSRKLFSFPGLKILFQLPKLAETTSIMYLIWKEQSSR